LTTQKLLQNKTSTKKKLHLQPHKTKTLPILKDTTCKKKITQKNVAKQTFTKPFWKTHEKFATKQSFMNFIKKNLQNKALLELIGQLCL
jgi:hypothetical protein